MIHKMEYEGPWGMVVVQMGTYDTTYPVGINVRLQVEALVDEIRHLLEMGNGAIECS